MKTDTSSSTQHLAGGQRVAGLDIEAIERVVALLAAAPRDRSDRQRGQHDAARRSLPGGGLASARLSSRAQGRRDEVGNGALRRAVFLDRDGVVNEAVVRDGRPYPPRLDELRIVPGTAAALDALRAAGFELVVVTNQPDLARGTRTPAEVDAIHRRLAGELPLSRFYVCPHDDADGCDCRKPRPGLLTRAARELGLDLSGSYLVGDRWRDVAAGQAAGVATVFLDRGYAEQRPERPADATVDDLPGAVRWILKRSTM
jgi:D-glycero-D-manno-heptose 1,7-bisphosphate phosphatase